MNQTTSPLLALIALFAGGCAAAEPELGRAALNLGAQSPNELPAPNPGGFAATFSTQGSVDLTSEYFQAQGTNGRSCETCHVADDAWSVSAATIQSRFDETAGLDPIFNLLDANNPSAPVNTVKARRAAYSMLLTRGVFRRGGAPRSDAEWELIAAQDPHGFASLTRIVQWRRAMPTINFHLGSATVNWDGGNSVGTDQHAGLINQATRNVTGGQQGQPAPAAVIENIVAFEESLSTTQVIVPGVGRLDQCGGQGNPALLAAQPKSSGRWNLFDAWIGLVPGSCSDAEGDARRAQIARGQELFNAQNAGGRSCRGCHNSVNDGTNVNNTLFDIQTASAEARTPDLPLYTVRNRTTGETRQLSDMGRGNVTGLWNDLGRFKAPTLRALAARAPYFHNGIADTLEDVVVHYEDHLGFIFTDAERADLVAFLGAL
jgi:cytochrome c peroxidase